MRAHFPYIEPRPETTNSQWADWQWQLRNSLKSAEDFSRYFELTADEQAGFQGLGEIFSVRVTPYYANLALQLYGPTAANPIRKIISPLGLELQAGKQQMLDPLGEKKHSPVPRIIHRYPDRVLLLATDMCSVYCRYCTRKHFTAQDNNTIRESEVDRALKYIASNRAIREVIFSGGDVLTLNDNRVLDLVGRVRAIEHVEIIRLASRMPVVCPMRITPELVAGLKAFHPIFFMTHFNHPKEITAQSAEALELLVDNGFPVFNQLVLLNGINNHASIVQALHRRLLQLRVKPYYLFQCDPSLGTDHLRTSVEESLAIQRELWGKLSGLAMANLSLDIPDGGGKVGLVPDFEVARSEGRRSFVGWDGIENEYIDPDPSLRELPADMTDYLPEWDLISAAKYGIEK